MLTDRAGAQLTGSANGLICSSGFSSIAAKPVYTVAVVWRSMKNLIPLLMEQLALMGNLIGLFTWVILIWAFFSFLFFLSLSLFGLRKIHNNVNIFKAYLNRLSAMSVTSDYTFGPDQSVTGATSILVISVIAG